MSSLHYGSSSQTFDEDDVEPNEEGTSRAQTPSPDTYIRELDTRDFTPTTDLPPSMTNLTAVMRRQTVMMNRQV